MKKILSMILTLSLCLSLSACLKINLIDVESESINTSDEESGVVSDVSSTLNGSSETVTDTIYNMSYEVPREWFRTEDVDGYDYDIDDLSYLQIFILLETDFYVAIDSLMNSTELQHTYMEEIVSELNGEVIQDVYSIDNISGRRGFGFKILVDIFGEQYQYHLVMVENGTEAYCFILYTEESQRDKYSVEYETVLNSLKFTDPK